MLIRDMKLFILRVFLIIGLLCFSGTGLVNAALIFSNTHNYAFGPDPEAIVIEVEVHDNYMGDFSKYYWQYNVINNSYDPVPGENGSNGFSSFETALPLDVPDIGDVFAPNEFWDINCCSSQPVEWDISNYYGLGIMPGKEGLFGFTTLPRYIIASTGWFHTWIDNTQDYIVDFVDGPEVPDVLRPPIGVPEPGTLLLLGSGLIGLVFISKRLTVKST